jgi:large subunit ribosomal protein L21
VNPIKANAMYAVIKTGGKQYRVKAGDLLVVEKLGGEPGSTITFDEVLMLGDGAGVTIGAPTVAGAVVEGALIETRKGEKIKVFKKIRRQGYRRTGGHRQQETVIRVTAINGAGASEKWDGEIDLTPKSVLNARSRALKDGAEWNDPSKPAKAPAKKAAAPKAEVVEDDAPAAEVVAAPVVDAPAPKAPAAKAKAAPKTETEAAPVAEAPAAKAKAAPKAKAEAAEAAPAKAPAKKAAPKAKAAKSDGDDA